MRCFRLAVAASKVSRRSCGAERVRTAHEPTLTRRKRWYKRLLSFLHMLLTWNLNSRVEQPHYLDSRQKRNGKQCNRQPAGHFSHLVRCKGNVSQAALPPPPFGIFMAVQSNLWHGSHGQSYRPGMKTLWHAAFTAVPKLVYFFCSTIVSTLCTTCVCTHIQTVYELPWNVSTHIGAVRSADWIFIVGAPVWRWLDQ